MVDEIYENDSTEPEYLSPKELAKKCNVSLKSITNWTQDRRLPAVKMGRVWRYPRLEIEKRLIGGRLLNEKK
jgi:excisionase family DNA binding protein